MARLASTPLASPDELLALVQRRALYGCGAVAVSLLASTLSSPATAMWTLDERLATLADELGCGYRAP